MAFFTHDGHRIAYTVFGEDAPPGRTVVLIHGLLFNQKLQMPLARSLARHGNRVVTIDLLGHGESDRPTAMQEYSMTAFGEQVIGLLDHLDVDEAVIGGLSLGANTALEACALAPERVRGLAQVMRRVLTPVYFADVLADWVRQDPEPSAAVMQGLFFARVAPPKSVRRTLTPPTLVIGHPSDPVHPWSDSDELVRELPDARLLRASSILEGRLRPRRITGEINAFVDECFAPRDVSAARAAPAA